jgi:5-methylcytosine-specific restriction endonuclease McrA
MVSKNAGRSTRRYRRLRAHVARTQSVCHLCGQPINFDLDSHDPMSFQVDHVVPRSVAPELAEALSNLKASHRSCNRAKSNRTEPAASPHSVDW